RLIVKEETLRLPAWPNELGNMRVAVISDVHAGSPFIGAEKLREVVERVNQTNPDLILIAGDFVIQDVLGGHFIEPEIIAGELKGLRARYGVYAVLGNHDWWYDGERVRRALQNAGIRVLENEVARIQKDGHSFWLAGLADFWTRPQKIGETLRQVSDAGPIIALTHNPDIFPDMPARVALTIAGHTHGGQVNLPLIGRPKVPSTFGQRYAAGHVEENQRHLFVTTGIGTSIIPVRLCVPPEIVVLTLTSEAQTH
ncbi:MAG TPA: metallophosphoesterase, partial [Pyrinomonadaceae bacterium]|nr:metallophosphoesterase [Pyrinomonadaceae bacterium]